MNAFSLEAYTKESAFIYDLVLYELQGLQNPKAVACRNSFPPPQSRTPVAGSTSHCGGTGRALMLDSKNSLQGRQLNFPS